MSHRPTGEYALTKRPSAWLSGRAAPFVLGLFTALEIAFVLGSLHPVALSHDEAAYLLQARTYAAGAWAAAGRPLPEFFEQYHVFVTPVLVSKYPPGHSLLMVPGIWLGMPALVPVGLAGVAGGLLFLLARRFANPWVALLTWAIWTTAPVNLRFLPGYFSQNTTIALWLAGWWALANWRERGGARWLALFAAAVAWGGLTRPFTTLAYALPAGWIVLRETVRRGAYRELGTALAPAVAILAVVPIWSHATTGSFLVTPYRLHSTMYIPMVRPGFGLPASTETLRTLPPEMQKTGEALRRLHASHTLAALPMTAMARLKKIGADAWGGWRWPLAIFALLGLFALPREGLFAMATSALLFVAHLAYAHYPVWSIYYLEIEPALAFAGAVGLWWAARALLERPVPMRLPVARGMTARSAWAAVLLVALMTGPATADVVAARARFDVWSVYQQYFRAVVDSIPEAKAIVFVRYGPRHIDDMALIRNEADLERARAWVVYDRGAENAKLAQLAPERATYLFDEATGTLARWESAGEMR